MIRFYFGQLKIKVQHFNLFIDRFSFIFQLKAFYFLYKFKDRAGGITHDELKLTRLTFKKTFFVAGRKVSSDVFQT